MSTLSRPRQSTHRRAFWDLAIGLAGLIYLGTELVANLSSPVFGLTLIVLAAYQMLGPRFGGGHRN